MVLRLWEAESQRSAANLECGAMRSDDRMITGRWLSMGTLSDLGTRSGGEEGRKLLAGDKR
jgi:hypothetical protein